MPIDTIVVSLIAVFFIIGILQGFIVSLLILISWVVGILSVWLFSGTLGAILNASMSLMPPLDSLFGAVLAFFLPFLLIRIATNIVKYFMNKKTSSLTIVNRLLGGVWGILKGIVIAGIFLTAISILPAKGSLQQAMEESVAYSIYKIFPFANLWEKFKLPKEVKLYI